MNIKMVGLAVVIAGVSLCVMFFDSYKYMVAALTVVVFGFLIALIGYLSDVKKQKIINDNLFNLPAFQIRKIFSKFFFQTTIQFHSFLNILLAIILARILFI